MVKPRKETLEIDLRRVSYDDWLASQLWNASVDWSARERCIREIPNLYEKLFGPEFNSDGIAWMLWDRLTFRYDSGTRRPDVSEEDRRVQAVMLECLRTQLMRSKSEMGQRAALHGLFHIKHPQAMRLVRTYLEARHPQQWLRNYAEQILRGEAL